MYVVTFYSYKGGVGRTMALANVAYLLAKSGKRVLAVDFDLEAPGLSSYGPFRLAGDQPGIVEYVSSFLDDNIAPDVASYIMECSIGGFPIWLMPAGMHKSAGYASAYSGINWQHLYSERDGFLLFEDLRQQWAQFGGEGFDYVLIDSRTGHTDIGGICTRQLPDAVVVQFLPTDQNIEGLKPIINGIRNEASPVRQDRVCLLFCPSNLPDGDDQELILKRALERAQVALKYKEASAEIYHYGALDLLEQPIYALSNTSSRLAAEYGHLHRAIIGHNLEDRDGALLASRRMRNEIQAAVIEGERNLDETLQSVRNDASLIAGRFPNDVGIAWNLALLAAIMTRPEDEIAHLNVVVEGSTREAGPALLRRARARASLNDQEGAVQDLKRLLTMEFATPYEAAPASDLLRRLRPSEWRDTVRRAILNAALGEGSRHELILSLMTERETVADVIGLIRAAEESRGVDRTGLSTALSLALIADGQFGAAMELIAPDRASLKAGTSLPDLFNYGLCEWAATGAVPIDLFSRLMTLRSKGPPRPSDANGLQCFALCDYLLDRREDALSNLRTAQMSAQHVNSVFSAWRYLTVTSKGMLEDLDEMHDLFTRNVRLHPPSRDGLKGANPL